MKLKEYYSGKTKTDKKCLALAYLGVLLITIWMCSSVNANTNEYVGHEVYKNLTFSITSNNAAYCNVTTMEGRIFKILNLPMEKNQQDFYITIGYDNFTEIGDYCFNIECYDGANIETGSRCFNVSPSGNNSNANIVFFIFIILIFYAITLIGFFGKNIPITILGGMAMLFLGVYMIQNGVIIYRDNLTNYFSYLTIAIGGVLALWAIVEWIEEIM